MNLLSLWLSLPQALAAPYLLSCTHAHALPLSHFLKLNPDFALPSPTPAPVPAEQSQKIEQPPTSIHPGSSPPHARTPLLHPPPPDVHPRSTSTSHTPLPHTPLHTLGARHLPHTLQTPPLHTPHPALNTAPREPEPAFSPRLLEVAESLRSRSGSKQETVGAEGEVHSGSPFPLGAEGEVDLGYPRPPSDEAVVALAVASRGESACGSSM